MWGIFLLAVMAFIAVLYVPGFFVGRAFRVSRFASITIAPAFSLLIVSLFGVLFEKIGIHCPGFTILATATAAAIAIYALGWGIARARRNTETENIIEIHIESFWKIALVYVAIAFAIVSIVYLGSIDGPMSFARNDDTNSHLSYVRSFLDTQTYSTLNMSTYLNLSVPGGFYPAALHVAVAIVASFFNDNVTLAFNAAVVVFSIFVFPLAICLLNSIVFEKYRRAVWMGSLFPVAFCGFPWGFLVFGQLLSNIAAFMIVPISLVLFISAVNESRIEHKIILGFLCLASLLAVALTQPNGVFTFGIWAALFCLSRCFFPPASKSLVLSKKSIVAAFAVCIVACFLWVAMYKAPFMSGVVGFHWDATLTIPQGIASSLLFTFSPRQGIQPFLSLVVLAGIVYSCRRPRYLWLVVAYLIAAAMFVIDVSYDGPGKNFLTGFWYTDSYRTGAMAALYAIPIAGLGFAQLSEWSSALLERRFSNLADNSNASKISICLLVSIFAIFEFLPLQYSFIGEKDMSLGLSQIAKELETRYSWQEGLTSEENAFIQETMEVIPEGALVVNDPSDGSCWAYGVNGLNTYYRRTYSSGAGTWDENELIKTGLRDIESSPELQSLASKYGIRYLIVLDDKTSDHPTTYTYIFDPEEWQGVQSIDENTPGFNLVLSKDDMRLYEITY